MNRLQNGGARRLVRAGVIVCFATSGLTSLVLEVVWVRMLGTVFGNTVLASSTVLTAFMLGLAIGSRLLGKLADRIAQPLLLYALLEAAIALYALLFPTIMAAGSGFYIWFYHSCSPGYWTLNFTRLTLSLLTLLVPTLFMGGTLPVLTRYLGSRASQPGQQAGFLYSANTWGGMAGCALAGFIMLDKLGVRGTLYTAGGIASAVGLIAGVLAFAGTPDVQRGVSAATVAVPRASKTRQRVSTRTGARNELPPVPVPLLTITLAVTGFCSLACEVLWTRILLFLLGTTVYAFAAMLTTVLAGMALGAFLSSSWLIPRVKRATSWLGWLEIGVGASICLSIFILARLGFLEPLWAGRFNWAGNRQFLGILFADAAAVLFLPATLMGTAFPIIMTALLHGQTDVGRCLGRAYSANTIGCVLGSLLAGFFLVPFLGTHNSLLLSAAISVALGTLLLGVTDKGSVRPPWQAAIPCAASLALLFAALPRDLFWDTINTAHNPSKLLFVREHSTATVTVHELPNGDKLVASDGVDVAGTDLMLRTTQKLQAYIPLCLHPSPNRIVQIGFGSGETARVGLECGVPDYTVVEISPAIFEAAQFFTNLNHGSYCAPRVHKTIMDGKNFALLSNAKFDLVMNDSIFPGSSGSSALYTYDHFLRCRERLAAPEGLFSCWVPLDLRPSELRMILKSFQRVFPHTSFWVASNCLNKHGLILGSLEPLQINFARIDQFLQRPAIKQDLAAIGISDIYDFLDCFICDEKAIARMTAEDPLNSDDHPLLEFSCARRIPWKTRLRGTLAMLGYYRSDVSACVTNLCEPELNRAEMARHTEASTHILRGLVAQLSMSPRLRRKEFDLACEAIPDHPHVKMCERELQQEIDDLSRLLETYPNNPKLALRLAEKLYLAMRFQPAAGWYERVLQLDSSAPDSAFTALAQIQFDAGQTQAAEQTLVACLRKWPGSAEAHDTLAGIYLRTSRPLTAKKHLEQARRLDPNNPFYAEHYAQFERAAKKK